jgi:KipI family sensor histidine kinase inhibitor
LSLPVLTPLGDTLVTVSLGDGMSEELTARVVARALQIEVAAIIGVTDVVPAYAAVGVHYDPRVIAFDELRERLGNVLEHEAPVTAIEPRHHSIPVTYDGADLQDVAARTGLSAADIVEIHSQREYQVFVIGFVPGFAYLGQLDERLSLPRRDAPRPVVPAGSVAIAERQTAIYPSATPGGWHLIGKTDVSLFDPSRESPSLFRVGDRVRFEPR